MQDPIGHELAALQEGLRLGVGVAGANQAKAYHHTFAISHCRRFMRQQQHPTSSI